MEHRLFFFAGGDHTDGKGNTFTETFISYLSEILKHRFSIIQGIYHPSPLMNVVWALNRAQIPEKFPSRNKIISSAVNQIISDPCTASSRLTLVSSSYGSVVAAQTACRLAALHLREKLLDHPFNLAMGASMVSKESPLYRKLLDYQEKGIIENIIYDELQDHGDNSNGIGGTSKIEAYVNALGICFPFLSRTFKGPSFLNKNPVSGHLHRVRAQSAHKAKDFLQTLLIDYRLGGEDAKNKATFTLELATLRVANSQP